MNTSIKIIQSGPSVVVLRKGGEGSGSWNGPGDPRFAKEGAAENVKFSPKLEEEIQYQVDNFNESAENGGTLSKTEAVQRMMNDMDEPEMIAAEFKKELQDFGISIGVWKPYTKEQLANMTISTSSGRRASKYEFKRGDRYYIFESWEPLMGKVIPELGSK
jgi:hypothetical protein